FPRCTGIIKLAQARACSDGCSFNSPDSFKFCNGRCSSFENLEGCSPKSKYGHRDTETQRWRDRGTQRRREREMERPQRRFFSPSLHCWGSVALWLIQFGYDRKRKTTPRDKTTADHP